jgi:Raf kinase inhibitor-like YbhB/YbcL family protein
MKGMRLGVVMVTALFGLLALVGSAGAASLTVKSADFKNGGAIPAVYAFCVPADEGHFKLGPDKNPALSWSKGPQGTQSYALIVIDPDVPKDFTNGNKEGKVLSASMPRTNFYHWILVDIPASTTEIAEAAESDALVPHGKPPGAAKMGVRGMNSYTVFMASNDQMKGAYGGYDGPCPPWNDQRTHHYRFAVYALDVPSLNLGVGFDGDAAEKAMQGHILAKGEIVGVYSLNPTVAKKLK